MHVCLTAQQLSPGRGRLKTTGSHPTGNLSESKHRRRSGGGWVGRAAGDSKAAEVPVVRMCAQQNEEQEDRKRHAGEEPRSLRMTRTESKAGQTLDPGPDSKGTWRGHQGPGDAPVGKM